MPHPFSSYFCFCYFNTTVFTDDALMANTLVFTTVTLPVFGWSEDFFTEKTFFFRFQGSVINGFGFFNLTPRPLSDFFR